MKVDDTKPESYYDSINKQFPPGDIVLYGYAGIQKHQPIDSSKYYFRKYIFYKNKKDTVNARKYKLLLEKYKSK